MADVKFGNTCGRDKHQATTRESNCSLYFSSDFSVIECPPSVPAFQLVVWLNFLLFSEINAKLYRQISNLNKGMKLFTSYYIWNVNYHAKLNSDLLLHQNLLESSQIATAATIPIFYHIPQRQKITYIPQRKKITYIPQRNEREKTPTNTAMHNKLFNS